MTPTSRTPSKNPNKVCRSLAERLHCRQLVTRIYWNLVITFAQVRRELAQDEDRELDLGILSLHEVSLSQFLVNGMELEEVQ